jgi:hypothetical protein
VWLGTTQERFQRTRKTKNRQSDEGKKAWHPQIRKRPQSEKPETGHSDRSQRSAEVRSENTEEEEVNVREPSAAEKVD